MISCLPFWQAVEGLPAQPATLSNWAQRLGGSSDAARRLVVPTGRVVSHVPSPIHNAPPLRVVEHADGTCAAVCDDDLSPRLELRRCDVAAYSLSSAALREQMATALGLQIDRGPPLPLPGVFPLGGWGPPRGRRFPVLFAAHPLSARLRSLVMEQLLLSKKPAIVVTPTARNHSADFLDWISDRSSVICAADEVLEIKGSPPFTSTDTWQAILDGFAARAGVRGYVGHRKPAPVPRRARRLATIDVLRKEVVEEAQRRAKLAGEARSAGTRSRLPPITMGEIGKRAGFDKRKTSRAFTDPAAADLRDLMAIMTDPDALNRWWSSGRKRPVVALSPR